ncbi:MAG TPA: sterol desaturase family protein [Terriglobia bacterium]|nr:sterol desaturase family protein [Terriglobia bacterium]
MDVVKIAIPLFLAMILVERLAGGARFYGLNDSISNLGAGIGQQIFAIPLTVLLIAIYSWLHRSTALVHWPLNSPWTWITVFLLVDLCYYWFHRASHRINFIWATHIVHHQSEELNLAVALRQSWLQELFSMFFYFPLAVLGFPVEATVTAIAVNAVGQFWFHTRRIGRMGWLEWVLNTPSHHRVHHAKNPQYLDRNYAGVLIIWDRLFGTFTPEEEEPVYGTVKPLRSWNAVWANVHYWFELAQASAAAASWKEKILVWFLPPGESGGTSPAEGGPATVKKYDARGTPFGQIYGVFIFLTALVGLFFLLEPSSWWNLERQVGAGGLIIWTLACSGGFLDGKSWAKRAEVARLAFGAAILLAI